jgi:glycosyltransferase involved in cell wall biosynthesis
MRRRILIGCYEVPGYGGASTASYCLFETLRDAGINAAFVNIVDEEDAQFYPFVFGPGWGNPRGREGVHNCVLGDRLWRAHPELGALVDDIAPDVMIGVGFIAALLMKRAAPQRPLAYLTSGCQQVKDAITRGRARDYLEIEREMGRGLRRPHVTCVEERDAMDAADLVVVHSEMTRRLAGYYYPHHTGKIFGPVLSFARWIHGEAREYAALGRAFDERDIDALFVASSWSRPEKNFDCVREIAAALPDLAVHVAGEAETPAAKATHHGLVGSREAMFALMGRARSVVCPSSFDTAPGILFEASALGANVVASDNCGNAAICDARLRVDEYRPAQFAQRIRLARARKFDDNIAPFLDPRPYDEFLEALDVL